MKRYQYVNSVEDGDGGEIHAEVYLCNKARQLLEEQIRRVNGVLCIFGVKKNCVTCSVRMRYEEAQINSCNLNYGRQFLNTTHGLSIEQAVEVVNKLFAGSYITQTREGKQTTHYDTDSEEDSEDDSGEE